MIKRHFDVIKISDQCYQLHSAGRMFKVEFDKNDKKKCMFESLLNSSEDYSKIVRQFKEKYEFSEILDFFFTLKQNGFYTIMTKVLYLKVIYMIVTLVLTKSFIKKI